jgi:integrase
LDGLVHDHREKSKGKPLANGTKVKIRNLMSAIFRHEMRYEFLPRVEEANPMKYVRQSGKRQRAPAILEVGQFQQLFAALEQRERTMCCWIAEAVFARGELIGLKWTDIDFAKKQMDVSRSVVEMVAGDGFKTFGFPLCFPAPPR